MHFHFAVFPVCFNGNYLFVYTQCSYVHLCYACTCVQLPLTPPHRWRHQPWLAMCCPRRSHWTLPSGLLCTIGSSSSQVGCLISSEASWDRDQRQTALLLGGQQLSLERDHPTSRPQVRVVEIKAAFRTELPLNSSDTQQSAGAFNGACVGCCFVLSATPCSLRETQSHTGEEKGHWEKEKRKKKTTHSLKSRAVKIKLREALGANSVIPKLASDQSWANKVSDVDMGTVDSAICRLYIMDLVARLKWEVMVAQILALPLHRPEEPETSALLSSCWTRLDWCATIRVTSLGFAVSGERECSVGSHTLTT